MAAWWVVNTSVPPDFGFSPMTRFGQWDVSRHDPCGALGCAEGWACHDELLLSPWEQPGSCSHWTKEDERLTKLTQTQRPIKAQLHQLDLSWPVDAEQKVQDYNFKALSVEEFCYAALLWTAACNVSPVSLHLIFTAILSVTTTRLSVYKWGTGGLKELGTRTVLPSWLVAQLDLDTQYHLLLLSAIPFRAPRKHPVNQLTNASWAALSRGAMCPCLPEM